MTTCKLCHGTKIITTTTERPDTASIETIPCPVCHPMSAAKVRKIKREFERPFVSREG